MRLSSITLIFFATICGIGVLAQAPGSPERAGVARTGVEVPATAGPERGTLVLIGGGAQLIADPPKRVPIDKLLQTVQPPPGDSRPRMEVIATEAPDDFH